MIKLYIIYLTLFRSNLWINILYSIKYVHSLFFKEFTLRHCPCLYTIVNCNYKWINTFYLKNINCLMHLNKAVLYCWLSVAMAIVSVLQKCTLHFHLASWLRLPTQLHVIRHSEFFYFYGSRIMAVTALVLSLRFVRNPQLTDTLHTSQCIFWKEKKNK